MLGDYCSQAIETVNQRKDVHGQHEHSFAAIASFWTTYLRRVLRDPGLCITERDVAMMMILFKISRETVTINQDNVVDIIGYADLYGNIAHGDAA